jgi:hypothetical protein
MACYEALNEHGIDGEDDQCNLISASWAIDGLQLCFMVCSFELLHFEAGKIEP